jgi:hypothetical protein
MRKELLEKVKEVIKRDELDTSCRAQQMVYQRAFIYHLMQKHGYSLTKTGELFNRSHATIINGLNLYNSIKNDLVFLDYVSSYVVEFEDFLYVTPSISKLSKIEEEVLKCQNYFELCQLQERIKNGEFSTKATK